MNRQELIERIYDGCEFPHCALNVYSNVYYGLVDAMSMPNDEFRFFFHSLPSPMYDQYKLDENECVTLTTEILEKSRIDILAMIADKVEYYAILEYDDGYDSE
tara:strand:- start:8391 stop:8699 length:309 start_codon:yes stop_codon:yes gene_type:complete